MATNHFTDTDLQTEWKKYLDGIHKKDTILYSAVSGFRFTKKDENTICVFYPSESARQEFEKIRGEFLNHFKHKVGHFKLTAEYHMDMALKREVVTKRKLFQKLVEINPLLKDLDDLIKFDLS